MAYNLQIAESLPTLKLKQKQMKDQKQVQAFLLGWALAVIIFCTLFAFVIRIERDYYNKRIEVLQKKCK